MREIDWPSLFAEAYPEPGATEAELRAFAEAVAAPLTPEETEQIEAKQMKDFPKAYHSAPGFESLNVHAWRMPQRRLPASYLSLLRWSNGGRCFHGERFFAFFNAKSIRPLMLSYWFPAYLPLAVPFATDQKNGVFFFDLRADSADGEYPVDYARFGCLDYDEAITLASSLVECCRGTTPAAEEFSRRKRSGSPSRATGCNS
jgi:hypothetical protein